MLYNIFLKRRVSYKRVKQSQLLPIIVINNMKCLGGRKMRIATQSTESVTKSTSTSLYSDTSKEAKSIGNNAIESQSIETSIAEEQLSKEKLQQAVNMVNEFLHINHNSSKFVLHDGLDQYFVQVVDTQTEEIIKEIPPKKLLDAFYEMQKLLGMIVDEKI